MPKFLKAGTCIGHFQCVPLIKAEEREPAQTEGGGGGGLCRRMGGLLEATAEGLETVNVSVPPCGP